jgi:hypothetical protein
MAVQDRLNATYDVLGGTSRVSDPTATRAIAAAIRRARYRRVGR